MRIEYTGATDFSGITWAGGEDFYAVSDKVRAFFHLRMKIEHDTGRILEARIGSRISTDTSLGDFDLF